MCGEGIEVRAKVRFSGLSTANKSLGNRHLSVMRVFVCISVCRKRGAEGRVNRGEGEGEEEIWR